LGRDINVICLLQPTTPFRSTQELIFIKNEMQKFSNSSYSLVSVCNVDNIHPAKMYFIDLKGKLKEIGGFSKFRFYRRQDLPDVFIRDGGFYIIGDLLIKKKMQYSTNPNCLVRKFPWSINIDNVSDLQLSQKIKSTEVSDDPNG
jgi:CMP-N-acetylneuraminic acid synthetase